MEELLSDLNTNNPTTDLNTPTVTDNRLTELLRPSDPILDLSKMQQKPIDYVVKPGKVSGNIANNFVVSKDYIEDKMAKSGSEVGNRLTDILTGGYPTDVYNLPTFLKQQEAIEGSNMHLSTHRPPGSGYTIGYGYDTGDKKVEEIRNDFIEAGIPHKKASYYAGAIKNGKKVTITQDQADKLGAISWRDNYAKGISIGLPLDKLDKRSRDIAISLLYRGDIVKGGSNYRGKLYQYVMNNNLDGALNYIKNAPVKNGDNDNIGIPSVLKDRWNKVKI